MKKTDIVWSTLYYYIRIDGQKYKKIMYFNYRKDTPCKNNCNNWK